MKKIFAYDFDGVVSIGIKPSSIKDVIITGRCLEEKEEVESILSNYNITNDVIYNDMTLSARGNHSVKSRTYSANHKIDTIIKLGYNNIKVERFFEDDILQIAIIKRHLPNLDIVHIVSNLVEK